VRFVDSLVRAGHPWTSELLGAIGRHHPSRSVAKAARKVAFKRQGFLAN
jgi:hypothetical protein